ncbi:MAG: SAM-dependent methyltransferase [Myxococcota bacterium]
MTNPPRIPEATFDRQDESPDALFYQAPRMVVHIDEATINQLRAFYAEVLFPDARVLDLMSSWVSHLPDTPALAGVSALGMNAEELGANPRADDWLVHDLNADPVLPYPDASFDFVFNAVSVQYLKRPFEVFAEIARVLRPQGMSVVAMSHRCFPTKAIRFFHGAPAAERCELVRRYHADCEGFSEIRTLDRSPAVGDPLWLVVGRV